MTSQQLPEHANNIRGSITKQEVKQLYNFSCSTFKRLFNDRYFDQLAAVGYEKNSILIPNKVYQKFKEIYGEPI